MRQLFAFLLVIGLAVSSTLSLQAQDQTAPATEAQEVMDTTAPAEEPEAAPAPTTEIAPAPAEEAVSGYQ